MAEQREKKKSDSGLSLYCGVQACLQAKTLLSLHVLGLEAGLARGRGAAAPTAPHKVGHEGGGGVGSHTLLGDLYILEKQVVDLRRQGLLEHGEQRVGLTAHGHGQREVLHAVLNVAGCQQFLAKLHFLKEESLNSFLVREIRECGPAARAAALGSSFTLLAKLTPKIRVRSPPAVKVDAVS